MEGDSLISDMGFRRISEDSRLQICITIPRMYFQLRGCFR